MVRLSRVSPLRRPGRTCDKAAQHALVDWAAFRTLNLDKKWSLQWWRLLDHGMTVGTFRPMDVLAAPLDQCAPDIALWAPLGHGAGRQRARPGLGEDLSDGEGCGEDLNVSGESSGGDSAARFGSESDSAADVDDSDAASSQVGHSNGGGRHFWGWFGVEAHIGVGLPFPVMCG